MQFFDDDVLICCSMMAEKLVVGVADLTKMPLDSAVCDESFVSSIQWQSCCWFVVDDVNPLKGGGVRWLHFEVLSAIQV